MSKRGYSAEQIIAKLREAEALKLCPYLFYFHH